MAEDNQDQAREMAQEGARKLKADGKAGGEGLELLEEAKRLDHDAIADIAPEGQDANRGERDNAEPEAPATRTSRLVVRPE
jgi:hypothetical protein